MKIKKNIFRTLTVGAVALTATISGAGIASAADDTVSIENVRPLSHQSFATVPQTNPQAPILLSRHTNRVTTDSVQLKLAKNITEAVSGETAEISNRDLQAELVDKIDPFITVENNRYVIRDTRSVHVLLNRFLESHPQFEVSSAEAFNSILNHINNINSYADRKLLKSSTDKTSIPLRGNRSLGTNSVYRWRGVTHTFYSDSAAHSYAYDVRKIAHLNAGGALIAGAIFGGVGAIPNGVTSVLGYMIADSVDYYANQRDNGVILNVTYLLAYSCAARR